MSGTKLATFKNQYRKIRHQIFASHNPAQGMAAFFASNSISQIRKFIVVLKRENFFNKAITGTAFPTKISQLGFCGNMPFLVDLDRTLLWFVLDLIQNKDYLNEFITQKSKYDHAFLLGQYSLCQEILDQIHDNFGYSLWELQNRIALTSETSGLDQQKQLTGSILSELQPGSVQYYYLNSFSRQCESNVSVNTFISVVETDYSRFLSNGTTVDLCKYAKYKLNGYLLSNSYDFLNETSLACFLYLDNQNALVDRYLSFVSILSSVLMSENTSLQSKFTVHLPTLVDTILDPFLKNSYYITHHKFAYYHAKGTEAICSVFDKYSRGEYQECIASSTELLLSDISYFPLVEVYAKSCIFLQRSIPIVPEKCIINSILLKLKQLFSQAGDIHEIQRDLTKILYKHLDTTWAKELLLILEKYALRLHSIESTAFANLYSSISLPSDIFSFDSNYIDSYMMQTAEPYRDSLTAKFALAVRKKDIDTIQALPIDNIRKNKYIANLFIETLPKDASAILKKIRKMPNSDPIYLEISSMLVDTELRNNKLQDAMEYFVQAYFKNSNFVYMGHIDKIFSAIKNGSENVQASILTPIICNIYFKHFANKDDRDDIMLNISYDEFLESKNVLRPSELLSKLTPANTSSYDIYFFAEVCVPNVMDRSLAFASSDEVLKERIVICTTLVSLDPIYQEKYTDEIHRLTNSLMIQLTRQEVETSKIYMDISGIKSLLLNEVCEAYERYSEFRTNDLNEQIVQVLNSFNEKESSSQSPKIYFLDIKQDSMLETIIKQTRDIFVADDKYGLDGYLSVRIRHGTLESELRSCFEKLNLITTKGIDGTYQANQFWYGSNSKFSNRDHINQVFSEFSSKIDSIISHLKRDLIQIQTEDKNPNGLFNFSISKNDISVIKSRIPLDASFEKYEEIILDFLLDITEESLHNIRNALQTEINEKFQSALNELQTSLSKSKSTLNIHRLSDQIATARTDISKKLKTIAEWFRLTRPDSFQDYQLSLAVSISCSIMQSFSDSFTPDITDIDSQIRLKGSTLPSVVDIFKILFDNVIKHSGLSDNLVAKVSVHQSQAQVMIQVSNIVAPNSVCTKNMDTIISQLSNWETSGSINREGGSGLYKIKKILSVDLQCASTISYSYEEDTFLLSITADFGGVLL